jgi:hypothetical protein
MAIDPKKLEAFANQGKKGGPPPPHGEPEGNEGAEHEEDGGATKFDKIKALLEQNSDDVKACLEELDPDALSNFGEELEDAEKQILREGFEDLEQPLVDEARHVLGGISEQEADELGTHLESEGKADDGHAVAAWLYRLGQLIESGGEEEDKDDEDESEEDDEEETSDASDEDVEDDEQASEGG